MQPFANCRPTLDDALSEFTNDAPSRRPRPARGKMALVGRDVRRPTHGRRGGASPLVFASAASIFALVVSDPVSRRTSKRLCLRDRRKLVDVAPDELESFVDEDPSPVSVHPHQKRKLLGFLRTGDGPRYNQDSRKRQPQRPHHRDHSTSPNPVDHADLPPSESRAVIAWIAYTQARE